MTMTQKLEIVRGTSNVFCISVKDAEGRPYILEEGEALVFGLKDFPKDAECVLVKTITNGPDGEYYLELTPADTANLEDGLYHYDIGLQRGENTFFNVIPMSDFVLLPNAAKCGDV